ncbi:hypothetical protein [Vogesella sp. LIG4]|uniref:hypothetical protein n=1 Tax=Vogesella sp. LIG4 TaxID=1192162 RepID=UPI0008200C70|nr:hypothetical protein [Vogesella sp. LIG4]SCK10621.1 hypothetical protein PSELUDRAFT_0818 [Vogesella sp. LIG4]
MRLLRSRWPQRVLLLSLLVFWLGMAWLGGNWLLAYEQARAQSELEEEAQQTAGLVRTHLLQLQETTQQLVQDTDMLQQMEVGNDPGHYLDKLRSDFPQLPRVARLHIDAANHLLSVQQVVPATPGARDDLNLELASRLTLANLQPSLNAGQTLVLPWVDQRTQLLLVPGLQGSVLAVWLPLDSLLPAASDEHLQLALLPLAAAMAPDGAGSHQLHARLEIRSGPFALRLELQRQLGWQDIHSPRQWLLALWLLLGVAVSALSYLRADMQRQRCQQSLQGRDAWLQRLRPGSGRR